MKRWYQVGVSLLLLAGCSSTQEVAQQAPDTAVPEVTPEPSGERYHMNSDAYPQEPPDVSQVPDAVPRVESHSRGGNKSTYEVWGKTYRVMDNASGYRRDGTASWYGKKFHGYATSNGEIYDMYKMSAAHRSLPLPTYARVTNRDNGKSVILRVNDRGPFHSEREIDLSYAAAARLGILDAGTGRVKVEAIDPRNWQAQGGAAPAVSSSSAQRSVTPSSAVYVQVAALDSANSASALEGRLDELLDYPVRVEDETGLYRVQVGPVSRSEDVRTIRRKLQNSGFEETFVVDNVE
ncbi:septal ring lytic transglycosylase RlpA family protein [Halomonas halocynthiae]|uniref:septal ring lytic transglycosylase RlpA family protein n=1 Tax=Halomonas halocynthiae TaxID=176290 RepID=UPI0004141A7B|nr:septal ring lytic transglycosylase RlpA family protein [Halomonas halocynthiae]